MRWADDLHIRPKKDQSTATRQRAETISSEAQKDDDQEAVGITQRAIQEAEKSIRMAEQAISSLKNEIAAYKDALKWIDHRDSTDLEG